MAPPILPTSGGFATSSTMPQFGMMISLNNVFTESLSRISGSDFFYDVTASSAFFYTGSSPTSSQYYLFITQSDYKQLVDRFPLTSSLTPASASFNPCTGSFIPGSSSFSGGFAPPPSGGCYPT